MTDPSEVVVSVEDTDALFNFIQKNGVDHFSLAQALRIAIAKRVPGKRPYFKGSTEGHCCADAHNELREKILKGTSA
jgi:hypothetical protein